MQFNNLSDIELWLLVLSNPIAGAADNVTLNAGSADGSVIAADDISSVQYQRVKVNYGSNGVAVDASTANPLPVFAPCFINTGNSSTSTLATGAVFTGTGVNVLNYSAVSVIIDASHDSTTDGMTFQFSPDDSNWDKIHLFTYTAVNGARVFQFPVHAKFFRVVYTNNGTDDQTHFRLQTILLRESPVPTTHRLVDDVDPDRSVTVVKSAIIAQAAGSGDFTPVQVTAGGNLKVSIEEAEITSDSPAKAEDSPSANNDVGIPAMARRTATPADTSGADLDYEMLQMDNGRLWASTVVTGTVTVDGSGVTQPVSGTVTANLSATDNTVLDNIQTAVELIDNAISGSEMQVDVVAPLPAGTNAIGKLAANDGVDIGNVDIASGTITTLEGASVAHDGVDASNPHKIGGRAQDQDAQPDEVANDDRVDALFDRNGYLRVRGDFTPSHVAINLASSGDNDLVAAQGAGKCIAVWSMMIVADGTTDVRVEDGSSGTAMTGQVPLQAREGYVYPSGGLVPIFVGSANTKLSLELTAAVNVHGSLAYTVVDG